MTINVTKDTGCNLSCNYCYEGPARDINGNSVGSQSLDVEAVIDQLEEWRERYDEAPGLHGGEPLLIDIDDLEAIFSWVYDHYESVRRGEQSPHIQTNGTMITDEHVELFKEYNVGVGISADGPPSLNEERQSRGEHGEDVTRVMSEKTNENLFELAESDVGVSVITVLHETNAGTDERLETLHEWMDDICAAGSDGHFNPAIPYDDVQTDLSLSRDRLASVYEQTAEWVMEEEYRHWDPFSSARDNLLGNKLTNCVNNRCDVFAAGAAKTVKGDGETTGCGKTWGAVGDGVPFLQGDSNPDHSGYNDNEERYEMLKQVPGWVTDGEEDRGGCKGCRFWNVCQGGCPASGLDQDFRNRTRHCKAKYAMYETIEGWMRSLFPNITLVTDYPWNANLSQYAAEWNLDIQPFAAMRPGTEGTSSTWGSVSTPPLTERVPRDALPEDHGDQVAFVEDVYGEEVVTSDRESGSWHADSAIGDEEWTEVEEK